MGSAQTAVCLTDGEPLILTFERPKKEFCCLICGRWYEYLEPRPAPVETPELAARLEELKARWDAGERPTPTVRAVSPDA